MLRAGVVLACGLLALSWALTPAAAYKSKLTKDFDAEKLAKVRRRSSPLSPSLLVPRVHRSPLPCPLPRRRALQEWEDDDIEDEDWHEDTYEWKKKKKANVEFDPTDPSTFMKASATGGGMQMCFCTLHPGYTKEETENFAKVWQGGWPPPALCGR